MKAMASDYDEFIYLDKYACEITIDKDKDKKTQLVLYFWNVFGAMVSNMTTQLVAPSAP